MTRQERWIRASYAANRIYLHISMTTTIQALGRVDVELAQGDDLFLSDFDNKRESLDECLLLNNRIDLSYLWVLGGYEVVRTICQRIKAKRKEFPYEIAARFEELKQEFNRLRVPLAKMEPASAHKNTDSNFAYPILNSKGITWQVSQNVYISRRELADKLLETLEFTLSNDPSFIDNP